MNKLAEASKQGVEINSLDNPALAQLARGDDDIDYDLDDDDDDDDDDDLDDDDDDDDDDDEFDYESYSRSVRDGSGVLRVKNMLISSIFETCVTD